MLGAGEKSSNVKFNGRDKEDIFERRSRIGQVKVKKKESQLNEREKGMGRGEETEGEGGRGKERYGQRPSQTNIHRPSP